MIGTLFAAADLASTASDHLTNEFGKRLAKQLIAAAVDEGLAQGTALFHTRFSALLERRGEGEPTETFSANPTPTVEAIMTSMHVALVDARELAALRAVANAAASDGDVQAALDGLRRTLERGTASTPSQRT